MIQPVVKPVVKWFDKRVNVCIHDTTMSNRLDNRLDVCLQDTAGCQTGLTTGCIV